MRITLFFVVFFAFLAACTPIISKDSLNMIDRRVSFAELRREPDRYVGKNLLLGGGIVGVRNMVDGNELELVQFATDEDGEITDTAASGGRFIAWSSGFLDPALYRPGLLVTLVGEVRGKKSMPLGSVDYMYPVLAIREMHLWKPEAGGPPSQFHFGFGVGTIIH